MPEAAAVEIPVFTELEQGSDTLTELPKKPGTELPAEGGAPAQKTTEVPAGEAPAAPEKSGDTDEQPGQRGKSRYERRLDKAYRRAAEAQARSELLEKQLAEYRPKEQQQPGAPRIEDFTDVQKWGEAYGKWESSKAVKQHEAQQQEQQFKRVTEQLSATWEEKASRGEKKYDDFDDVVGEIIPDSPATIAIMQAENGDDIAHYLGTHLKEARRIAQLDPISQAREIGRLEMKLLAEPPKPKTVSKAPAPIVPVSGTAQASGNTPSENDDDATWIRKRQKQVHGR